MLRIFAFMRMFRRRRTSRASPISSIINVRLQMGNTRIISTRDVRARYQSTRTNVEQESIGMNEKGKCLDRSISTESEREKERRGEWEALSMEFLRAPRRISSSPRLVSAQIEIENILLSLTECHIFPLAIYQRQQSP